MLAILLTLSLLGLVAATPSAAQQGGGLPWEQPTDGLAPAGVGQGFTINEADAAFILDQILIGEAHAASSSAANPCGTLIGTGPNQIPAGTNAHLQPLGIRTVDGTCNNLLPNQEEYGAADRPFPRLTTPTYMAGENLSFDPDGPGPAQIGDPTTYAPPFGGPVQDSEPRIISNLIVDQTVANPAAVAVSGNPTPDTDGSLFIQNAAPDEGLSASFNQVFTLFGQFFDHGLDLTTKAGAPVFMPLVPNDDPLWQTGSNTNFMVLDRASIPGGDPQNLTTPFVDQQQTYASHASVQVFLREYEIDAVTNNPVSNGRLINGPGGEGLGTWGTVKAQGATLLGIDLSDVDALDMPLIATDAYGKFIPGANGNPQLVLAGNTLLEGDRNNPVAVPANVIRTGHPMLADISNFAVPGPNRMGVTRTPDADNVAGVDDNDDTTYDDEMFDAHFVAGDGRVNENIGLSAIHHVFHSEHNRLVADLQNLLSNGDPTNLPNWEIRPGVWNGERLFQAARFINSMEYQHLAFEEFGRKVQPLINVFDAYDPTIDPAITVEFSQAVYRFGHSMLNPGLLRWNTNNVNSDNHVSLLEGFLNPPEFFDDGNGGTMSADQGAGALFRGATIDPGNEIDEFVIPTLQSNLLGLPLDLAALNIARGREYGLPPFNDFRRQIFAQTANPSLAPFTSWTDFGVAMSNPESLVNFIAAYGTHPTITGTLAQRRAAAQDLLDGVPTDSMAFVNGLAPYDQTGPGGLGGLEDVDLWIGGLAEASPAFGGMLGDTFNYVFETQMEDLQSGDRFYYLGRLGGTNLLTQLEGNSFSEMIERNSDAENLPADVFAEPQFVFDIGYQNINNPNSISDDLNTPDYDETQLLVRLADGTIEFTGGEHANMFGGDTTVDLINGGIGDDTIRGNDLDDVLEGGGGADLIIGGAGNDRISDANGDEDVKAGPGNDAINGGNGFDLLQAGTGHDFVTGTTDPKEVLAGAGNDLLLGGDDADDLHGGDGDDWAEGGGSGDGLEGDSGLPVLLATDINDAGDDVLIGNGGDDRHFAEGGNDISVLDSGSDRIFGLLGNDWATLYGDPADAQTSLLNNALTDPGLVLSDRFLLVENLSGFDGDDILDGDHLGVGEFIGNELVVADSKIAGVASILPVGTTTFDTGNILIGGRGDDTLQGGGGDDILDGDAWLQVQLEAPDGGGTKLVDTLVDLRSELMNGDYTAGDVSIVRTIETEACACTDTAVYTGPIADYDITVTGNTAIIDHARGDGVGVDPTLDNGTDYLQNIEQAQFADATIVLGESTEAPMQAMSFTGNMTLPGAGAIGDEDIVSFDAATGDFTMVFDGSDTGLPGAADVDGFTFLDADSILMSFVAPMAVPGIGGTVDDSDIVQFDATSLGENTAGTFTLIFDGSDHQLTTTAEDVDAVHLLGDGSLLVSTTGQYAVAGAAGGDEDLIQFTPTVLGDFSAGTWSLHFDGSDVAMVAGSEDVTGAYVEGPDLALTTIGGFSVAGLTGADEDIISCDNYSSGPVTSCGAFTMLLDGSTEGIAAGDIDGIDLIGPAAPPAPPVVSIADVTAFEGSGGGTTNFDFVLTIDTPATETVTVQVDTTGLTATAGSDYTEITGQTVTWNVGDPLTQTVTVAVSADDDVELDEEFFVDLSNPTGNLTISDGQALGTILDDDAAPPRALSIDDVTLNEGNAGETTAFQFTVSLDGDPGQPVSVQVDTADGTAVAPDDYTAVAGLVLTFNPGGALSQTVTVDVSGDDLSEGDETFTVDLSAPTNATIGDGQGIGTIVNDDQAANNELFLSFTNTATLGAVVAQNEDIIAIDPLSGVARMVFDGTDAGLPASSHINAFTMADADTIIMSFLNPVAIPGLGTVDDSDLVQFSITAGTFAMFLDGTNVSLTGNAEDIDAVDLLADGTLVISTIGNPGLPGVTGDDDADLLLFTPTVAGDYTSGSWEIWYDASDVGHNAGQGAEDVDAVYVSNGDPFMSTVGNFNLNGFTGGDEDVFTCVGFVSGLNTSCGGGFALEVDGSVVGLAGEDINGMSLP